jgi:hypothetical protein
MPIMVSAFCEIVRKKDTRLIRKTVINLGRIGADGKMA